MRFALVFKLILGAIDLAKKCVRVYTHRKEVEWHNYTVDATADNIRSVPRIRQACCPILISPSDFNLICHNSYQLHKTFTSNSQFKLVTDQLLYYFILQFNIILAYRYSRWLYLVISLDREKPFRLSSKEKVAVQLLYFIIFVYYIPLYL